MTCPKCNSDKVQMQSVRKKTGGIWGGGLLLTLGLSLLLSPIIGIPIGVITLIVLLCVVPKNETVGVCQECAFTFDPKTKVKK